MEMREWALIAFTILAQMAVGSFVVSRVAHLLVLWRMGEKQADEFSDRALWVIGPVLLLGLLASLLHLGNPLLAYKTTMNAGTSWLSREIVFAAAFGVLGGMYAFAQWRRLGSSALRIAEGWAVALVGLVLVYVMAMVYMLPTRPSWNVATTPVQFYLTTLLLGVATMGPVYIANYVLVRVIKPEFADEQGELLRGALKWLAVSSIALMGVAFVVLPLGMALQANNGAGMAVAQMIGEYAGLFALRLGLLFLGAGVLGILAYEAVQKEGQDLWLGLVVCGAFAFVLAAEVLGRVLFYATALKVGLQ